MLNVSLTLEKILSKYRQYIDHTFQLPEELVNILLIHASLLNITYIFYASQSSWLYCIVILVRPSILIQIPYFYIFCIIFIVVESVYIINNSLPGSQYVSLINCLMKVSVLNFVIEQFNNTQGRVVGAFILLLQIFDLLFLQGTLDVNTKNFQLTQTTILSFINLILNMVLMILYKFEFQLEVLQILAIINSAINALELLITANQRSKITRLIMIAIQFITLYLGLIQFIHYENSYSLVLIPFYFKLISFIKFSDFAFTEDPIINASILLQKQKFYECFIILNKLKEENFVRAVKRNVLMKKCVNSINSNMQLQLKSEDLLGVAEKLISNDIKNIKLSNDISKIVSWKMKLLQNWKDNDFDDIYQFITMILKVKSEIDAYYLSQPFGMIQALICFFYAEILNDLLEANELIMHVSKSADTMYRFNFQSKSMYYVIAKYENGTLLLDKVSSNAPSFICNKSLYDLIPPGVREQHAKLVDLFLVTGQSRYVRQLNENYINYGNHLETIHFAIDLTYVNQVSFICLVKPTVKKNVAMIVDDKYTICSMTDEFANIKNSLSVFIKGLPIVQIIPEILKLEETTFLENIQITPSQVSKSRQGYLEDVNEDILYCCDMTVKIKKIQKKIAYLIILFENIRVIINSNSTKRGTQTIVSSSDKGLSIAEEVYVKQEKTTPAKLLNEEEMRKILNIELIPPQILTSRAEPDSHLLLQQFKTESKKPSIKSFSPMKQKPEAKAIEQKQNNQEFDHEAESQVSSIRQLRNSKFYRKYNLFNKFNKHMPLKKHHQLVILLFVMSLSLQGLFIVIQLTSLNLVNFAADINLLEIKNLFFQPLDLFLVTRMGLWSYNSQKTSGLITQSQYDAFAKFPTSNLALGFDQLNNNFQSFISNPQLQELLQSKYLQAFCYVDTYKEDQFNMTLRTAMSVLLNFEYILKMNYIYEKTVNADSPQIFYSFKNYPIIRDMLSQLNDDVMVDTLARGENFQNQMATLFIFQQVLLIILIALVIIVKNFINTKLILFLNLSQFTNSEAIQLEIEKFSILQDRLKADNSYKFTYHLDLEEKEKQFKDQSGDKEMKNTKNIRRKKIPQNRFILILLLFYLALTTNSIVNYLEFYNYLILYPQTAVYKKQLSDLSGDIPLMFAQKEALYFRKNYMYLNSDYFVKLLSIILDSLNRTKLFTAQDQDFSKMLVSQSFKSFYSDISDNNLCLYLPDNMKAKSTLLCPITLGANMQHGLKAILIYLQNLIETEMALNIFSVRINPNLYELDGVYLVSTILNVINQNFYNDLIDLTTQLVNQQQVIIHNIQAFNICYLIFLFFLLILIITEMKENIYKNSKVVIHFVYLIPSQTLFNDDAFERTLRTLINLQ